MTTAAPDTGSSTPTGRDLWARRVRDERKARGWRQVDLADRAKVSRHAVAAVEAGRSIPDETRVRIATAFALPWHVVFNLDDLVA